MLDHQLDRLVAGEEAVLDAVDAGADAGADARRRRGVRGDLDAGAVRLVDDRVELLVGVLLRAGGPLCDITPPDADTLMSGRRT